MVPAEDIAARYPERSSKVPAAAAADNKKRHMAASQPVDADDLRRRLYVVISEQNAAEEKRRTAKAQASATAAKVAAAMRKPESPPAPVAAPPLLQPTVQPTVNVQQKRKSLTPLTLMQDITHWATQIMAALDHTSDFSPPWSKQHSPKVSETPEYKLHAKASSTPSSAGELTPGKGNMMCMYTNKPTGTVRPKSGSAYVPRNAATQFVLTTTSDAMLENNKTTHRLSMRQSSVPEGFNLMRKRAATMELSGSQSAGKSLVSPTEDKEQRRQTMRPAIKGGREKEQQRGNPFEVQQGPPSEGSRSKRTSYRNSTIAARRMTRDLDLMGSLGSPGSPTGDRHISVQFEEPEMPHEPRVDWTQSDECEKKKSGMRSPWKRDSRWGFMDRKFSKSSEGESSVLTTVSSSAANSPRSPPKGFLSRFSIRKQSTAATF
jgi:hypothetical protein